MVTTTSAWKAGAPLAREAFAELRRRTIFDCCKWDPQFEDVSVLCPFPIILSDETWRKLSNLAESLATETLAAEHELVGRSDLHGALALPRRINRVLRHARRCKEIARVMRFDFHLTTDGWRITEVNSDVPGGFIEAAGFTRLMSEHYANARMAGDPARALAASIPRGATVALVHATAYTDDRQVMDYLARELAVRDITAHCVGPTHLRWSNRRARIETPWLTSDIDAIIRFFPGEWLTNLPSRSGWRNFFSGSLTPMCNPATALLTQSKRLPLIWDELRTPKPTWRKLLPESRDPRRVAWRRDSSWLIKPALGRVGEDVGIIGVTPAKNWKSIERRARWFPRHFLAQRRFDAIALDTPDGPQYPCIGVYTIDGVASGIYGRIAPRPLIDGTARDVAVLVDRPHHAIERREPIDEPTAATV